ncbi:MAG: glycoside hydrolase family 75 protein [Polyangiaceae bacterium]
MPRWTSCLCLGIFGCALLACGDDSSTDGGGGSGAQGGNSAGGNAQGGNSSNGGSGGAATGGSGQGGSGQGGSGGQSGVPTAADLLALTTNCDPVSGNLYQTDDDGSAATIPVCTLNGGFFWKADMDIDCDGQPSDVCNLNTDPAFQAQTSATDSNGDFLDAKTLPYVVIPLPSNRFDYETSNVLLGAVVAVIYNGQVTYGVFGDEGPDNIIGEASYAMASLLGIDPDPSTGGTDSGVTYIVFTGGGAVVDPIEDHAAAVTLGQTLAAGLIQNN